MSVKKILRFLDKIVDLEEKIGREIKKEKSAKKRASYREAVNNRDTAAIRDKLFNPDH